MRLIAITREDFFDGEAGQLQQLLGKGFWRVHLRKPGASRDAVEDFISQIPQHLRPRISVHDHFDLAVEMGLGGIHLNGRNHTAPDGWHGIVSRSCHSIEEIIRFSPTTDYMFLSPVFDSISKQGYQSAFDLADLAGSGSLSEKVFALGGVTPRRIPLLEATGFGGAAMLGAAWDKPH